MNELVERLYNIKSEDFDALSLDIFKWQAQHLPIYQTYLRHLNVDIESISSIEEIPFLPISFFKTHQVIGDTSTSKTFKSSGTTGMQRSQHFVTDLNLYHHAIHLGFQQNFGDPKDYCYLALLPNYLEQGDSSLVYMVDYLMQQSNLPNNGFYLDNHEALYQNLIQLKKENKKVILIGVTYALIDFLHQYQLDFPELIVLETGGMKGRKKEMIKEEVLDEIKKGFGIDRVYSEYGMTELLSQSYALNNEYTFSPSMKILLRDPQDPFSITENQGGINVIDLANIYSCSFIETMDLGKRNSNGTFSILGRFDHSDLRGCNLLVANI